MDDVCLTGSYPHPNHRRIATRHRSAIPMVRMHHFCTLMRLLDHTPADHLSLQLYSDVAYRVFMHLKRGFKKETFNKNKKLNVNLLGEN